jgi:hypothetical protein
MRIGRIGRTVAVLVATSTAVLGLVSTGSAAGQTSSTTEPAAAAAGWLARQMVDGDHLETDFGGTKYPDQGLTADAVLAFNSADVAQQFAAAATAWLARADVLSGYVGDGTTESYAGALAKVSLVAMAQDADPRAFGGVDLVGRLLARKADNGRFSDKSQFGDFSNVITQSLAIIALIRNGRQAGAAPVDFLVGNQCADGGFALQFAEATCNSEVDATAFAIQALLAAGRDSAAAGALKYLQGVQRPGGGFGGGAPTSGTNANSTGLAAQALRLGGRDAAADAAVRYLLGQQIGCGGPAEQRGAIAYDANGFDASTAVRATAQAVYGLTGVGLLTVDKDGDLAAAPTLACAPPTTTTTAGPTTTSASTTSAAPASSSTSSNTVSSISGTAAVPVVAAPRPGGGAGELPATGARPVPLLAIGTLLVLVGVGLALLGRRNPVDAPQRRRHGR